MRSRALLGTVAKRIEGFLVAARPNAYCAQCIAKSLGLSFIYDGNAEKLAREAMDAVSTTGFAQDVQRCSLCERRRPVMRAVERQPPE
jgi:hypothetical protein